MNEKTLQENIRTLSAIIGKNEQTAADLLDVSVSIVFDEQNLPAIQFASYLQELLRRTVRNVSLNPLYPIENAASVIIGNSDDSDTGKTLYVRVTAKELTISRTSLEKSPLEDVHPILLLLSACYTAAQVVKEIVGEMLPVPHFDMLRINFDSIVDMNLDEGFDIGTTYLAGAGAVGNGFVFALSLLKPQGELHVADPDVVDYGNLNRCMWFNEGDIGLNKAEQLVKLAQPKFENLKLIAHASELQKVPHRTNGAWLKRLVIGVDSRRVRRNLQNEFPGEVYDASTTDIREVILHFNRQPLSGNACLSCIYFQDTAESAHEQHVAESLGVSLADVQLNFISADAAKRINQRYPKVSPESITGLAFDSLFKQLCGQGALKTAEDKQVFTPFSFISVLAGTLLAIEFAKRMTTGNPIQNFNYWRVSPWNEPVLRAQKLRSQKENCEFCGNKILLQVSDSLWG